MVFQIWESRLLLDSLENVLCDSAVPCGGPTSTLPEKAARELSPSSVSAERMRKDVLCVEFRRMLCVRLAKGMFFYESPDITFLFHNTSDSSETL